MITMTTAFTGVLLVFLGYLIGIIHGAVVAVKENMKDKEYIAEMEKILAKMTVKLNDMLGEDKEDNQ